MRVSLTCRLLVLTFLAGLVALQAQTFRGSIQGTIADSSGGGIPGVEVSVTDSATGLVRRATTGDSGNYTFTELPLGTYVVSASKTGFGLQTSTPVQVLVGSAPRVDLVLSPGEAKTTVEVRANVEMIETSNNNQGGTIAGEAGVGIAREWSRFRQGRAPGSRRYSRPLRRVRFPGLVRHFQHERQSRPLE